MVKKAMVVAVTLAVVSAIALANVAFAAPPADKQSNSHGKAKVNETDGPTEEVDGDVEENIKCTIDHKGHDITVSINAIPAHLRHGDNASTIEEGGGCPTQGTMQEQPEKMAPEGEPGGTTSDPTPPENTRQEPTEGTTAAQQENEPTEPTETTGTQNEEQTSTTDTETVKTCDGKSIKLKKEEKLTLDLHNKIREKLGRESLCVNQELQNAARAYSKQMSKTGYFSHTSRNGQTLEERLKRSGYKGRVFGENIAWGSGTNSSAESRVKAWVKSPEHMRNMLNAEFDEVGVGVATSESTRGRNNDKRAFYTVDFGAS